MGKGEIAHYEQILDPSKLKEFADEHSKFDENGKKMGRKHKGKRRNCSLRAISPFPTVFSKDLCYRHVKNQGLFGKGLKLYPNSKRTENKNKKEDFNFNKKKKTFGLLGY